ncbi:putative RNA-binding protein [Trypanosoma theileri]|uniref:Putative RNA-binding protein n=1 Tax=Trypanosoma theileri TaxID=67003 RepID=A0A1X0NSA6_9TRYP|nr:putative RNA-binding protein [Trypanosoma theileri]ORC87576.1 putative RNA-binding protein [Trypanosoma theileri]
MPGSMKDYTFTPFTEGRLDGDNSSGNRRVLRDGDAMPTSLIIDNTCRVYITQIPLERIERDGANALRAEFEAFGPVESYKMFTERSGRFIGSVLCTYRNPADASMAVQNMNDRVVDSSVLKVSLSRDHGVVLLHQAKPRGRRGFDDDDDDDGDGKWQHDQYQAVIQGGSSGGFSDNNYNNNYNNNNRSDSMGRFGARRGGRGRGRFGAGGRRENVEEAFERYIASRDKELAFGTVKPDSSNDNNNTTTTTTTNNNNNNEGVELERKEMEEVERSGNDNHNKNSNSENMPENGTAPVPIGGNDTSESVHQ